jgi:predicted  nucleic acid-binding Zn-ribbon protein
MCQEGLLTEEQLQHALSVQESTGRPLGEVIVRLGYASPGAVANALAEQYGGTLRTEYGVSAGLGRLRTAPPPPSTQPTAAVGEAQPAADEALTERARAAEERVEALETRLAELQQVAAGAIAARERADSAERELEGLRNRVTELDRELAASREAVGELTAKLQVADQPDAESPAAAEEVDALEARVAELEQLAAGAAAAQERADSAERELEGLRNRMAELDTEPAGSREAVAELAAEPEAEDQTEEPSPAAAENVEALEALVELEDEPAASREAGADLASGLEAPDQPEPPEEEEHLLFVPSVAGYSLARRAGACPEPGTLVKDLGDRTLIVARIGPSPLGGRLRCAYLEPAR